MIRYLSILLIGVLLLPACQDSPRGPVSETRLLMGTYLTIQVFDPLEETKVQNAIASAFDTIKVIEDLSNPYNPNSTIGRINSRAGDEALFPLHPPLLELTRSALEIAAHSGGAFDPTLWPAFRLWHFNTDSAAIPDAALLKAALDRVDYRKVLWEDDQLKLTPGTELDLGGVSKGFAVEAARGKLLQAGLQNFIIDAGGNLGIEWHLEQPVTVKIRHPRKDKAYWASFPIRQSCGIATSGDYHFYFEENGRRYHHLLDPATGFPPEHCVAVTLIAPSATLADGYATAVFIMGPQKGEAFLAENPGLQGSIIYPDSTGALQTFVTPGLQAHYQRMPDEGRP